jgi:alkylation response protein AidB-like acyl-CoA dehydrogenase
MLNRQDSTAAIPTAEDMIGRARALIPALSARAPQGARDRRIANDTIAEMQAAGLFRVLQPKRWGGYELDIHTYFEIQMALAEGDMSVAWVYGVVGIHPWMIALLDDRAAGNTPAAATIAIGPSSAAHRRAAGRRKSGAFSWCRAATTRSSTPGVCPG